MAQIGANLVYQDFEPFSEWTEDKGSVTLTIMLPGFRRDQLKVQVTSTPVLRINGEREITQNVLRRFSKEFSIPSYCDTNHVTAKFELGVLHVKFPKIIQTPPPPPPPPTTDNTNKPQDQEQSKKDDEEQDQKQKEAPSQEGNNDDDDGDGKEKEDSRTGIEKDEESKKSKESEADNDEQRKETEKEQPMQSSAETEKGKEEEQVHSELSKTKKGARIAQRLKTRMLDFTLSVSDEKDVGGKGYVGNLVKRPKMLVNIVVTLLLVMVLGIYFKDAFWPSSSSSSSEGGSENYLQEF